MISWRRLPKRSEIRAERARRHLLDFTTFTFPQYRPEPVHRVIAAALDEVIAGRCRRLMIFAPPQHGKSELVSVRLPAFWLAKRPNDPVILSSYGASLASSKSRQARNLVESTEFVELFPRITTDPTSRAVDRWDLARPNRASMLAAGVGGPVTGHGAMLGIIDDPFENWEQAQSATIRDNVWDWYRGTFRTRIWEHGAIILIMTRWHEADLAGRLLLHQPGQWTVLRLPAVAENQEERDARNIKMHLPAGQADPLGRAPGEPLSPKRFSSAALASLQTDVGPMVWSAEYQNAPTMAEGTRFKRDWFPIVDQAPANVIARMRYWDKAASTKASAKRTAGVLMSKTLDGYYLIEHVVCGQWATHERRKVMKQTAQLDGVKVIVHIEQEPGSSGLDSVNDEIRFLEGFAVFPDRPTGDKDTRLEPFAAQAGAGNVRLLRGDWNGIYIDEMCAIPNGTYRDQADGTSGAFNKLVEASQGTGQSVVIPPPDVIDDYDQGGY